MDRCIETSSFDLEITSKVKTDDNISLLISRERKKLERIKDAYENGVYTLEEYKQSRSSVQRKIDDLEQSFRTQQTGKTDEQAEMERFRDKLIPMMQLLKTPAVPEEIKNYILKSFVKRIVFDRAKCDIEIFFNMSSTETQSDGESFKNVSLRPE